MSQTSRNPTQISITQTTTAPTLHLTLGLSASSALSNPRRRCPSGYVRVLRQADGSIVCIPIEGQNRLTQDTTLETQAMNLVVQQAEAIEENLLDQLPGILTEYDELAYKQKEEHRDTVRNIYDTMNSFPWERMKKIERDTSPLNIVTVSAPKKEKLFTLMKIILEKKNINESSKHILILFSIMHIISGVNWDEQPPAVQSALDKLLSRLYVYSERLEKDDAQIVELDSEGNLRMDEALAFFINKIIPNADSFDFCFPYFFRKLLDKDWYLQTNVMLLFYRTGLNSLINMRYLTLRISARLEVILNQIKEQQRIYNTYPWNWTSENYNRYRRTGSRNILTSSQMDEYLNGCKNVLDQVLREIQKHPSNTQAISVLENKTLFQKAFFWVANISMIGQQFSNVVHAFQEGDKIYSQMKAKSDYYKDKFANFEHHESEFEAREANRLAREQFRSVTKPAFHKEQAIREAERKERFEQAKGRLANRLPARQLLSEAKVRLFNAEVAHELGNEAVAGNESKIAEVKQGVKDYRNDLCANWYNPKKGPLIIGQAGPQHKNYTEHPVPCKGPWFFGYGKLRSTIELEKADQRVDSGLNQMATNVQQANEQLGSSLESARQAIDTATQTLRSPTISAEQRQETLTTVINSVNTVSNAHQSLASNRHTLDNAIANINDLPDYLNTATVNTLLTTPHEAVITRVVATEARIAETQANIELFNTIGTLANNAILLTGAAVGAYQASTSTTTRLPNPQPKQETKAKAGDRILVTLPSGAVGEGTGLPSKLLDKSITVGVNKDTGSLMVTVAVEDHAEFADGLYKHARENGLRIRSHPDARTIMEGSEFIGQQFPSTAQHLIRGITPGEALSQLTFTPMLAGFSGSQPAIQSLSNVVGQDTTLYHMPVGSQPLIKPTKGGNKNKTRKLKKQRGGANIDPLLEPYLDLWFATPEEVLAYYFDRLQATGNGLLKLLQTPY